MLAEVLQQLRLSDGETLVDGTFGAGGYSRAALEAARCNVIAIDRDPNAIRDGQSIVAASGGRLKLIQGPFSDMAEIASEAAPVDAVVLDIGVSSMQIDDGARGFSFLRDGPLDMRMGDDTDVTAWQLVRALRESALADVIYQYGEERASRPIARAIKRAVEAGEMDTTRQLAAAVYRVLGPPRPPRLDPATRTFQALRIAVNDELGELDRLLAALPEALADGGVAAVISFHSLEDRRVKHALRDAEALEVMTKKPIEPGDDECRDNPRARSAKLRAARRVARGGEAL